MSIPAYTPNIINDVTDVHRQYGTNSRALARLSHSTIGSVRLGIGTIAGVVGNSFKALAAFATLQPRRTLEHIAAVVIDLTVGTAVTAFLLADVALQVASIAAPILAAYYLAMSFGLLGLVGAVILAKPISMLGTAVAKKYDELLHRELESSAPLLPERRPGPNGPAVRICNSGDRTWDIEVGYHALQHSVGEILTGLLPLFHSKPGANNLHVRFLERDGTRQAGIDAGGLRREFISTLFDSVAREANGNAEFPLKFTELESGGMMPEVNEAARERTSGASAEEERLRYRFLGKMMGMAYTSNGELRTGQIFSPKLFNVLLEFSSYDLDRQWGNDWGSNDQEHRVNAFLAKEGNEDPTHALANRVLQARSYSDLSEEDKTMVEYLPFTGETLPDYLGNGDNENLWVGHWDRVKEDVRAILFDRALLDPSLPLIFELAKGLRGHLEENGVNWEGLRGTRPEVIDRRIQGVITVEATLEKLEGVGSGSLDRTTREHVKRWVRAATPDQLKAMVKAITGAPTLPSGKLQLDGRPERSDDPERLANFHTCFKSVEISTYDEHQYALFARKWQESIEYALASGFQQG